MTILIQNGQVINPATGMNEVADVLVENGVVSKIEKGIKEKADRKINAKGCFVMPGFIDMHVHLRDPGFEEKLTGAITSEDAVVVDGNIITSRGMGTAIDFGLAIVDCLTDFDEEVVEHVKKGIVYRNFEEV